MNQLNNQTINTHHALNHAENYSEQKILKRLLHACLREKLLDYQMMDNFLVVNLPKAQKTLICKNARELGLGKLKFYSSIILLSESKGIALTRVKQLLNIVYNEVKNAVNRHAWKQFSKEIYNCAINESLVDTILIKERLIIKQKVLETKHRNFLDYITEKYSKHEQLAYFESFAANGHPYHPCHKTKLGFTSEDYLAYSPEFKKDVPLFMGAISTHIIQITGEKNSEDYQHWFAKEFPQYWEMWAQELNAREMSIKDYCPFFVHPWQYENVLTKLFKTYFESGQLHIFSHLSLMAKPSLSFRTLMPKDTHHTPHIKLPVAVYSTSAMRTITPSSVHNGPNFCSMLKRIFKEENHFGQTIKVASEICGLYIHSLPTNVAKNLGIIFRDNPTKLIEKNEVPIVVAALFEKSPLTEVPLYVEMIHASLGNELQHAVEYFSIYCAIVLRSYFDIFLIYGCALEGHQQNTIAIFENHRPKYMITRDSGGLRVHPQTLAQRGFHFDAHPDSSIIYEDSHDVTETFIHTVLQYHLGEIVSMLAEYYGVSESVFWTSLRTQLEKRFEALKAIPNIKARWDAEYQRIMVQPWQIKGLMRMRLKNDAYHYESITVPNPLRVE